MTGKERLVIKALLIASGWYQTMDRMIKVEKNQIEVSPIYFAADFERIAQMIKSGKIKLVEVEE